LWIARLPTCPNLPRSRVLKTVDEPPLETPHYDTVSSLVRHLERTLPPEGDVSIGQLLAALGMYGFVFFLLILALLNVAIFMLPGLSILFGVPMVILAVQVLLGIRSPIFPAFVRDRAIRAQTLQRGLDWAIIALERIEPAVRPRLLFLTHPTIVRAHFLAALLLAFMVAIPLPFVNLPPTFGVILLAVGLMQRDGLFILAAYAFAGWSLWLYESLGRAAGGLW